MYTFFAALILASACSAITIKTLIGYSDMRRIFKIFIAAAIILGWFGILLIQVIRSIDGISPSVYAFISHGLYNLMGFVFLLFVAIILRDFIWYSLYGISILYKKRNWNIDPNNLVMLNKTNVIVIIFSIAVTAYALHEGYKLPEIKEINIVSDKIKKDLKIVQLSDLHINRATPVSQIRQLVYLVNKQAPDVIVLTGDTIDDNVVLIEEQLAALKDLNAPAGIFSVMGNHEFYNDVYASKRALEGAGLGFLFNGGVLLDKFNVFIAGIPDLTTMHDRLNLWRTMHQSTKDEFKILLSHTPMIADSLSKGWTDLVLSGHTHGGQIFPFHFFVQKENSYLAGKYSLDEMNLVVSRGAGTWGPTMRLFAPADIIVLNLSKK